MLPDDETEASLVTEHSSNNQPTDYSAMKPKTIENMLLTRDTWLRALESLEVIENDFPASSGLVHSVREELTLEAPFSWIRSIRK